MTKTIKTISAFWDTSSGEHPDLVENKDAFYSYPSVLNDDIIDHFDEFDLPITACLDGHNVMTDSTISEVLDLAPKFCLSPNFVRDLSGRFIYVGYGPEQKSSEEWSLNKNVTFPKNCRPVTPNIEGSELIENVFFTRFRCLETSVRFEAPLELIKESYLAANLYPYKLRLDSFYQDGWRLPQVEMLYTNPHADQNTAEKHGQNILSIWEKMSHTGASYKDFYNKLQETGALEKMFFEGCTLIPTFEGSNGFYDVDDNFSIIRQRAGRAVEGLHIITQSITSSEPEGTIVEVITPGYLTGSHIHPAEVIVSDGKRYSIEHRAKGLPQHPDLRLPHTRTSSLWKKTWVPTAPHHFSHPAIWYWGDKTGRFLQKEGPLWDPLHYYYESVPIVLNSFKNSLVEEQPTLAYVPKHMKKRFYPVTRIKGFDICLPSEKGKRREQGTPPFTNIIHIQDNQAHADIGYHPLPLSFEYELSTWVSPDLIPTKRITPPNDSQHINLVPIITPKTPAGMYRKTASDINEFERLGLEGMVKEPLNDPLENYPHLHRYLTAGSETLAENMTTVFLGFTEDVEPPSEELLELYHEVGMSFYEEVFKMRQKAVLRNKKRSEALENVETYIQNDWLCNKP